jgi:hypothetical protein
MSNSVYFDPIDHFYHSMSMAFSLRPILLARTGSRLMLIYPLRSRNIHHPSFRIPAKIFSGKYVPFFFILSQIPQLAACRTADNGDYSLP